MNPYKVLAGEMRRYSLCEEPTFGSTNCDQNQSISSCLLCRMVFFVPVCLFDIYVHWYELCAKEMGVHSMYGAAIFGSRGQ